MGVRPSPTTWSSLPPLPPRGEGGFGGLEYHVLSPLWDEHDGNGPGLSWILASLAIEREQDSLGFLSTSEASARGAGSSYHVASSSNIVYLDGDDKADDEDFGWDDLLGEED